ncbi:MAG TPA: Ig-like domain-containing protein [Steroidobacteraceae bacterium]|nr:Ig-like domain-containing protein [Steroidobacteraceae bacterium]
MTLLRATRFARAFFGGYKPVAALHLLCLMAFVSGCHSSSGSYSPPAVQLTSIAVGPPDSSVAMGLSSQFTATGLYSDGSKQDVSSQVTWSSTNAAAAWISNAGLATTAGPGSTLITAKLGKMSGSTSLNVTAATLVVIDLTPTNASLANGLSGRFIATGVYTDNSVHDITASVTWASSVNSVASISNAPGSNGMTTTTGPGSTIISASLGAVSASTTLTVTSATLVSIEVTPTNPSVANGLSETLQATGVYTDHSTHDLTSSVTWSSSVAGVAWVSNTPGSNGLATTATPGSTTITAMLGATSGSTNLTVTAATLVSLGVTPANPTIAKGLKSQFIAIGTYTDNSTQILTAQVEWSSSDPTVATVSNALGYDGFGVGLNPGSVTITATLAGASASTILTVTPATLVSIGVTPANPSIANGLSSQFAATGVYTDNSTQDLTASVAWTSSDPTVVSISNASASHGLATGVSPGSVAITAASGSVSGSTNLTVTPAALVSIALIPANPSIANGTQQQFAATGTYTDTSTHDLTAVVTWSASDTTVATISNASGSNGLATSVGQGSVTITATLGTIAGATGLTVTPAALVSIAVIPANASIANGTGQQFAATGTYTDNSTQPLTTAVNWSSSDTTVASISNASGSNGLASSTGQGAATISATLGTISGSTGLTVTAATLVSIAITPLSPSITDGTTQQFTATGTYTDNSTQNLTASVTWTSSDTTIASVSNAAASSGLATAAGVGTTSIGAALGAVTAPVATLTATAAPEYAYASNQSDNTVSQYAIGAGGVLSLLGTQATGTEPNAIAVVPSGRYLYVANWVDATLSEYTIGTDGTLSAIGTVATGVNPASNIVDPTSSYVYVANLGSNSVSEYAIGLGGALTTIGTITAGSGPACIAIDPTGHYVYTANQNSNDVSEFAIGPGGTLTSAGTVAAGGLPQSVAIDPTGRYAYVANYNDGTVSEYTIGTGGLTSIGSIAAGSLPESLVIDPTGHYVYAANHGDNTVSEYQIGTGGALIAIGAIAAGNGPWYITMDASGRYVYVANFSDNTVSQYSLGTGGALTFIGTVATGSGPNAVDTGL